MSNTPWQRRIARAEFLSRRHPFAAEILGFYVHLARFQEGMRERLRVETSGSVAAISPDPVQPRLLACFGPFLSIVEQVGPERLAEIARSLREEEKSWPGLLSSCWSAPDFPQDSPQTLLAAAFLQPYAELLRSRTQGLGAGHFTSFCPFCMRKAGLSVLRQQGDGASRSLLCSFCLEEWNFRRIICAACGEEDSRKLPVYSAAEFEHIRVECCDSCKRYIKSIDLTKDGLAEPIVDELASAPLDLWAQERGYSKIQLNLLGL